VAFRAGPETVSPATRKDNAVATSFDQLMSDARGEWLKACAELWDQFPPAKRRAWLNFMIDRLAEPPVEEREAVSAA
jgi:hypothetical protein